MAAAPGNQYAAKARVWTAAIQRALAKRSRVDQVDALDELAEKLIEVGMTGDLGALKELGDRLEGKVAQSMILSQDHENPLFDTLKKSDELRGQIRQVGHRTPESQQQDYIEPVAVVVAASQQVEQVEQVDPE